MISVQNRWETSRSRTFRTRWLMPRGVMARSLIGVSLATYRAQMIPSPTTREALMLTTTTLTVEPIAGALGAEISGVDLGAELDDATIADIRRALLEHCVIFFRDQDFDAEQHKRLARRFGEIFVHPIYVSMKAATE